MEKVVAIFDIGKTNKKLLLFNSKAELVFQHEEKFPTATDDDGFECDDMKLVEDWITDTVQSLSRDNKHDLRGVNFATYGASLAFIDKEGRRLAPIYNYLKPVDKKYGEELFSNNGGQEEFCRQTASPALGLLLNSGIQIKWLKYEKPAVFNNTSHILHLPQYLSFLLTGNATAEHTSIGCHTCLWDFDNMSYHEWLTKHGITLPTPEPCSQVKWINPGGKEIGVGIGIHDSSASLVPYLRGHDGKFMLVSTGTWCINMNPFNHEPLTDHELRNDCLCYLSVNQKPVKSSRLFMGHLHDVNSSRLSSWFNVSEDYYKSVSINPALAGNYNDSRSPVFFAGGIPAGYIDESVNLAGFSSFEHAYHQLMFDLTKLCAKSINLVLGKPGEQPTTLFVSGGFSRNPLFMEFLSMNFPGMKILTSKVDNSSALGAALVILDKVIPGANPGIDLGLKEWKANASVLAS